MLNSGKKNSRYARQKKKYSNSRVVCKKNSERNKKPVTSEITNQKYREDTCICRHRKQTLSLAGTKHGILAAVANWAPYISKATFLEPQQLRERPFNLWFFSKKIF